jgi:cbb3-type cytochrome oxidase subunit 3
MYMYLIPMGLTWLIVANDILPDWAMMVSGAIAIFIAVIFLFLDIGFFHVLKKGESEQIIELRKIMLKDSILKGMRQDVKIAALLLLVAVWIPGYAYLTLLMAMATIYAIVRYWDYIGTKYDNHFKNPGGFT